MKVTIRPDQTNDIEGIKRVNDAAFGQENEGNMVNALRKNSDFMSDLSLVAVLNDEIVGHILFYPVAIKIDKGDQMVLSLAPMSVHPDHQNKGIGSQLVGKGLDACMRTEFEIVIVLGHPKFYPRFGFKSASNWGIYLEIDAPDEAFMALELKEEILKKYAGAVQFPKEYFDAL